MDKQTIRYIFYGTWGILVAANLFILIGTGHAKVKRVLLPVIAVLAGVTILLFLVAVPVVILVIVLNLRQFKDCVFQFHNSNHLHVPRSD